MLIGIPGCGKSTWAKQHKDSLNAEILSSDRIREEHFGDVNDQSHNVEVFDLMLKRTQEYLNSGINVIYDATNVNRRRRVNLIKSLPENAYTTAILFATPFVNCCGRNNLRDRKVPEDVMWKFYKTFQAPWYGEGFHDIYIEYDEKLAKRAKKEMQTCFDTSRSISHDNPHHTATIGIIWITLIIMQFRYVRGSTWMFLTVIYWRKPACGMILEKLKQRYSQICLETLQI